MPFREKPEPPVSIPALVPVRTCVSDSSSSLLGELLVDDVGKACESRSSSSTALTLSRRRIAHRSLDLVQRLALRHQLLDPRALGGHIGRLLLNSGFVHYVAVPGNKLIRV